MSSREQSPEVVLGDGAVPMDSPERASYQSKSTPFKSYENSAARGASNGAIQHHVDAENDPANAAGATAANGKADRSFSSKSDALKVPLPTVSQLRASASLNRASGSTGAASESQPSTVGTASPSQSRMSGAAARNSASSLGGRPPAVPPLPLPQQQQQQPAATPAVTAAAPAQPARPVAKAPSASQPRPTATLAATRRTGGSVGSKAYMPKVATAAPNYAAFLPEVSKYLKEVVRRRDEAATLRLLPSAQLLEQAVLQEQAAHEQIMQQQTLAFLQITHKKKEAEAKMKEQQTTKANKAKMEEQKLQHKEEMMQQKASVTESTKEMEAEIKERLKLVVTLQPRLSVVQAVMAQVQDPASDFALLGELMQEDRQLQKALKADARYNKSKTADVDGGALPYWWKQCVCASFNIAAIMKQDPCRASIVDVAGATKVAADKKVVVVRDAEGAVVAWAHTRTGADTNALVEAFLEAKPEVAELPAAAYLGVLWPKDDAAEVLKAAKGAKSVTAAIAPEVITTLTYKEVGSSELLKKDVVAAGEAAS